MKTSKGFTIIELLVVIAIIAVLAAVVMVNVTSYVGKAKDASVKADLSQISTTAAVYSDDNGGNMDALCTGSADLNKAFEAAKTASGKTGYCGANDDAWAVCVGLAYNDSLAWCIDSASTAESINMTDCNTGITVCP